MVESRPTIVVLNDTAVIPHYGCKVVMKRLVDTIAEAGFAVKTISVYDTWEVHKSVIDQAAGVIVNGEGTIHHSAPRGQTLVSVAPYCQERNIPVFLINTVWQDNSDQMAHQARNFLLRYTRESWSERQLEAHGLETTTVADLTLGWKYQGVGSRAQRHGHLYTDAVGMRETDLLHRLYREDSDARYVVMTPPRGHRGDYPSQEFERLRPPFDHSFPRTLRLRIVRMIKRTLLIRGYLKNSWRRARGQLEMLALDDFMGALESSELVVTGRFHGVCLCLVTGTPFLALTSNSHKIEGMLADAGLSHRIVRPADIRAVLAHPPEWTSDDAKKAASFVAKSKRAQATMMKKVLSMIPRATDA